MTRIALTRARRGAVLALVGALLLANPAYVGLVVDEPRSRSPTGYTATAVDPGAASDQRTILQTVGGDDLVAIEEIASANEYEPHGDAYRAPGAAAEVLRAAVAEGTATTTDPDAAFTLRRLLATHRYVVTGERGDRQFYRATVEDADGGLTVALSPVDRETVARHVVARDVRLYTSLPDYQRETVAKVLSASEYGYRPYNDEFVELTDRVLLKDGTYYVFQAGIHADDFGPSTRGLVSIGLGALGALALLAGAVLTGLSYRAADADDDAGGDHGHL